MSNINLRKLAKKAMSPMGLITGAQIAGVIAAGVFVLNKDDIETKTEADTTLMDASSVSTQNPVRPQSRPANLKTTKPLSRLYENASAFENIKDPGTIGRQLFVMDAKTGTILINQGGDIRRQSASLTKMMTGYIVFRAFKDIPGKTLEDKLKTKVTVPDYIKHIRSDIFSFNGRRSGGREVNDGHTGKGIKAGEQYELGDLLTGMGGSSDAISTITVALYLGDLYGWGNNKGFTTQDRLESFRAANFMAHMNVVAQQIGMDRTNFAVFSGAPIKSGERNISTPADMAKLMIRLEKDFPELSEYSFGRGRYDISPVSSYSTAHSSSLTRSFEGWGKTGTTNDCGGCLAFYGKLQGREIVAVSFGSRNGRQAAQFVRNSLDEALKKIKSLPDIKP